MTQWVGADAKPSARSLQITAMLERAAAQRADDAVSQRRLAQSLTRSRAYVRAVAAWQRVVELTPEDGPARLELANLLLEERLIERAVETLRQSCALHPNLAGVHAMLGRALRMHGDEAAAEAAFDRAIALAPDEPICVRAIGRRLIRAGKGAELADHCAAVAARRGWSTGLLDHRAIAMALQGRADDVAAMIDYPRLLREQMVSPPTPFASIAAFNRALADEVRNGARVKARRSYASDIVSAGTSLAGATVDAVAHAERATPASAALNEIFRQAFEAYANAMEAHPDNPFPRLKPARARLAGGGHITRKAGHVRPHIHSGSWLVGVYYVAVPETPSSDLGGCLELGPPDHLVTLPDGIWPRRLIRPVAGLLLLFPGYFPHRTWPNSARDERIVVSLDAVPVDA